jgi:hypothetical protein
MSAVAKVYRFAARIDCWLSHGGSGGRRGQGPDKGQGTPADAWHPPHDGERTLTQGQTGALRGLIARPMRRLIEQVKRAGDPGLALRRWEPPLHRRLLEKVKATGLRRSATLRGWLLAKGESHF